MQNHTVESRAEMSKGESSDHIHKKVADLISATQLSGPIVVDIGCGTGAFLSRCETLFSKRIGIDVIKHPGFPNEIEFRQLDLESGKLPLESNIANVVTCLEVLEHLENPRATVRELARITKPGGLVVFSTPNLLSCLNIATLILKSCNNAFQDGDYPAHITPILEVDLKRMASEAGLSELKVHFTEQGRILGTAANVPNLLSRAFPRRFSDNIILTARK